MKLLTIKRCYHQHNTVSRVYTTMVSWSVDTKEGAFNTPYIVFPNTYLNKRVGDFRTDALVCDSLNCDTNP